MSALTLLATLSLAVVNGPPLELNEALIGLHPAQGMRVWLEGSTRIGNRVTTQRVFLYAQGMRLELLAAENGNPSRRIVADGTRLWVHDVRPNTYVVVSTNGPSEEGNGVTALHRAVATFARGPEWPVARLLLDAANGRWTTWPAVADHVVLTPLNREAMKDWIEDPNLPERRFEPADDRFYIILRQGQATRTVLAYELTGTLDPNSGRYRDVTLRRVFSSERSANRLVEWTMGVQPGPVQGADFNFVPPPGSRAIASLPRVRR